VQSTIIDVLENEGLLNIIPFAAQPELDNESVGSILGKAAHAALNAKKSAPKRVGGWQAVVPEEHASASELPDLDALVGDEVHERLKVRHPKLNLVLVKHAVTTTFSSAYRFFPIMHGELSFTRGVWWFI
jgi:hypothetical protein